MGSWDNLINKIAEYNTPSEWRETGKLAVAAILACGTWGVLGWLILSQFNSNVVFADKISTITPTEKDRIALVKDANETVNKTASSLYAFITPFATAITGYFFISSGTLSARKNEGDSVRKDRPAGENPTGG
jgi:hypothetical protein